MDIPTTAELNHIARKINLAFRYVRHELTTEELYKFEAYIKELETIRPLIDPTGYIHNEHAMILEAANRLKALQAFFKALK